MCTQKESLVQIMSMPIAPIQLFPHKLRTRIKFIHNAIKMCVMSTCKERKRNTEGKTRKMES
jgi:hypothetical protein